MRCGILKLTTASCWSSTNVWAAARLWHTDVIMSFMLLCDFMGGGICPYPRCVGHPYKTGDWTEWWGACRRASGQSGPTTPRGCGPSSSSCTLKIERLGGRTAKQGKDRKCVVQLASENVPVGSQYGVRCVSNRVQLIWLFLIILNIHLQEKFNLSLKVESNQWWKITNYNLLKYCSYVQFVGPLLQCFHFSAT